MPPAMLFYWVIASQYIDYIRTHVFGPLGVSLSNTFTLCWRGHMTTSSNGKIFRLTALWAGNSPVTVEFPTQRPVTRRFYVFFDLRLIQQLSKQSRRWWFETPSCALWRHCYVWTAKHEFPDSTLLTNFVMFYSGNDIYSIFEKHLCS